MLSIRAERADAVQQLEEFYRQQVHSRDDLIFDEAYHTLHSRTLDYADDLWSEGFGLHTEPHEFGALSAIALWNAKVTMRFNAALINGVRDAQN